MAVIVNDSGFNADDWDGNFVTPDGAAANDAGYGVIFRHLPMDAASRLPRCCGARDLQGACARGGMCWLISMQWRVAAGLMRSRSAMSLPHVRTSSSGLHGPTGASMTIRRGCADKSSFPISHQRLHGERSQGGPRMTL